MRLALGIEYNGAHFHGWQKQPGNTRTVQAELERGLSQVASETIHCICAGRTDAKVHGLAQVVHFDTQAVRKDIAWVFGVNSFLPPDIRVLWMAEVTEGFHARFSALSRTYEYVILNAPSHSAVLHHLVTWECRPLAVEKMAKAGQCLLGTHDFTAFRAGECQAKTAVRTIEAFDISQQDRFIKIRIKANAFLQHMVRNIVGSLLDIGRGTQPVHWMENILSAKNRQLAGRTAAANGLYLCKIEYPKHLLSKNIERYPNY